MPMTVSDAASIQTVLRYLLGEDLDRHDHLAGQREHAVLASLMHLADRSRRVLQAGLSGEQVRERWVHVP